MRMLGRVSLTLLAVLAASAITFAGETRVTQGKVTAVSEKTVTLADAGGVERTYQVTQGARVYAEGATHRSKMLASSGRKTTIDNFVREGNYVTVHYREEYGTRSITRLRVL
jgi:hypothetical protein